MESGPACRPGSRPRMLMCYLCGREYGTRSLPIHIPQCQRKWLLEEENKPKNERRPLPSQPNAEKAIRNGGAQAFDNFNTEAFAAFEQTLKQCPHCQRRFLPKPFLRHQKGCTAANPAKPAGTGLIPISLTNRLVPGAVAGSMRGKASGIVPDGFEHTHKPYLTLATFTDQHPFKVSFFPRINNRALKEVFEGDAGFQHVPLRLCKPSEDFNSKSKLPSRPASSRPVWTNEEYALSFDDGYPGQNSNWSDSLCVEPRTRNRLPSSRPSSHQGNGGSYGGGEKSHLVDTFGNLWRTHSREDNTVPLVMRHKSGAAQEWCSQAETETSLTLSRAANARPNSARFASECRQSPRAAAFRSSQAANPRERSFLDLVGLPKTLPNSGQAGHSENYKPMHRKTGGDLRHHQWRHH